MADGKNSIIVYRDWKNIFDELTDEEAGKLIKHFFSYISDENPTLEDKYLRMAFLPIKDALKRDLKHWESVKQSRSESGRIGGLKSGETRSKNNQVEANEANASLTKQNEANEAVNVIVNDIVNVNDIVIEKKKEDNANKLAIRSKEFEKSLIPFLGTYTKEMLREFCNYWTEPNKSKTKMLFEMKPTWDTSRRLATWAKRDNGFKPKQNEQPKTTYKPIRFNELG